VFVVTYPENDPSQTPAWKIFKKVVDNYAQRKIEEEEARGYPSDEDYDFKRRKKSRSLKDRGSQTQVRLRHIHQARDVKHALNRRQPISSS
jgi:hypothetical protein